MGKLFAENFEFSLYWIAGSLLFLLFFRKLLTWYWKINVIIKNQESLNRLFNDIKTAVLLQTSQLNEQLLEIANCLKGYNKENIHIDHRISEEVKKIFTDLQDGLM